MNGINAPTRHIITPSYDEAWRLLPEVPDFANTAQHEPPKWILRTSKWCKKALVGLRFDATALPVDGLRFMARQEGVALVVDLLVPDRDKPDDVVMIHVWRSVMCPWEPIHSNGPEHLVRWMRETIANVMAHEVDESIAWDGKRVFDPHRALRE